MADAVRSIVFEVASPNAVVREEAVVFAEIYACQFASPDTAGERVDELACAFEAGARFAERGRAA